MGSLVRMFPLLVGSLPAVGSAQLPRSLIVQGGFEGTLDGWEIVHGQVELDGQHAHGGAGSVRLTDASALQTPLIPYQQQFIRVALWMRTEGIERGKDPWNLAGAQIAWFDANRQEMAHEDLGLTAGTTEWVCHEGGYFREAKEEVAYFQVRLMIWNTRGTAWFDDVAVEETEPPEAFRKVPLLSEVEDHMPRFWPLPELQPVTGPIDVGTLEVNFATDRDFFIRPADPRAPEIMRMDVTVNAAEPVGFKEAGLEAAAGYYWRHRSVAESRSSYPALEVYTEAFRGSPIVSQFFRLYMMNDSGVSRFEVGFGVPEALTQLSFFEGNRLRTGPLEDTVVRYRFGYTPKPFIVLHDAEDSAGIVVYYPTPAEVRRWHVEDYIVEQTLDIVCRPVKQPNGRIRVSWEFRDITTGPGGFEHSFDLTMFLMPYSGTKREALAQFQVWEADLFDDIAPLPPSADQGYWTKWMGSGPGERLLRMARYHPREFASWIPGGAGGCYGHRNGHMWGNMTIQMKGIRVDPLAERALARDHAIRMLHFFIERANERGAPPDMSMWRELAARLPNPEDWFTHVFCQYWEYRLGEFRRLMQSPYLTEDEKGQVYLALQRARNVFDADIPGSWTRRTPNGGYWFEYVDLPIWDESPWIINTHATSVGNAGQFWLLANERGEPADAQWWAEVFRRGVDGLLYALGQAWMWYGDAHDPNELRYGGKRGGPRSYHGYMLTAWMPEIIRTALLMDNYRVDELLAYYNRMMQARYLADDPKTLSAARDFLRSIGRGG